MPHVQQVPNLCMAIHLRRAIDRVPTNEVLRDGFGRIPVMLIHYQMDLLLINNFGAISIARIAKPTILLI